MSCDMGKLIVSNVGKAYKKYSGKWARVIEWITGVERHQKKWVLDDINFLVNPGEAVGKLAVCEGQQRGVDGRYLVIALSLVRCFRRWRDWRRDLRREFCRLRLRVRLAPFAVAAGRRQAHHAGG